MSVLPGIDVLARDGFAPLAGKRVGLLTNPSGVTRNLARTVDVFRAEHGKSFTLGALFSPEHGLAAAVADGEFVESARDPVTGVPIYSLYGETFAPTRAMLDDLDVIVCDLQDIGVRYYTYAWTITHVIEAAGMARLPVILLDRPNPLGGDVDGARLDMAFASLVGRFPIPVQHGMTLGEVMLMFNTLWNPNPADVRVIACEGYERGMTWEQTGLHFVPPSPAMPHVSTVRHYPGACLIEGTTLSEGRGTALPFEITGAPFIDEEKLADHLNGLNVPGAWYRPHVFQPSASKFSGQVCRGVQVHITGSGYRSMVVWGAVIEAVCKLYPDDFAMKPGTFDRLYGNDQGRKVIESGGSVAELSAEWDAVAAAFRAMRGEYLIY